MRQTVPLAGSTTIGWRPPRDRRVPTGAETVCAERSPRSVAAAGAGGIIGRVSPPVTDQRTATRLARTATTRRTLCRAPWRDLDMQLLERRWTQRPIVHRLRWKRLRDL